MKDEIKEINIKIPGQILDYVDTKEHLLELFNYITNLQEEVNKLTAESTEWESKCYDLQEENERLKEIVENLTTMTVNGDRTQIKNTAQYKLDIYKSRNEKAKEELKKIMPICIMPNNMLIHGNRYAEAVEKTLKILEGEDKDE